MGLDFDAIEFCRTLLRHPAPYKCPVEKCGKSYKSIYGLQYHLVNFDHDHTANGTNVPPNHTVGPHRKKGGGRGHRGAGGGAVANSGGGRQQQQQNGAGNPTSKQQQQQFSSPPKEGLTYLEAQKMVQFDIDGRTIQTSVAEPIAIIDAQQIAQMIETKECVAFVPRPAASEAHIKLPEASYRLREDYNICDAPARPNAYIRFIEKSAEELDGEVEYDVDEEDTTWLAIMNERRAEQNLAAVSVDTLELLMDRLEKESYFQAAANGQSGAEVDDDAVCCICVDGECQNTNVILFCDMCNLAVHQDCYGVPYIPEGQWLCRRCLQSPSRPVDCVLCPNTGGAFKQTDHNQWAHVVCALWIPEVRFANTVFLEPIDSIENIPAARWRLTCYICKQRGVGACIQCQRSSCYAAFHVTCAQQAGLHMRMDTVRDEKAAIMGQPIVVQKTAYCDAHGPVKSGGVAGASTNAAAQTTVAAKATAAALAAADADGEQLRKKSRMKMKLARETLAKKRSSVPLILIPTIPPDRLAEIGTMISVPKKTAFLQRLIAYWTLKRQYRNGVPLLRRLQSQSSHGHGGTRGIEGSPNAKELQQQLKYWQCLRQDLERARLLCELVRKREKLKAAYIRTKEAVVMMELNPLEATMSKLLAAIAARDTADIFGEPVDVSEVPDYTDVVTQPMDLSTMRRKHESGFYYTLDDMQADFDLMIRNCLAYNNKDTVFYRAGVRMRDQGGALFRSARAELEAEGVGEAPKTDDALAREIDDEFRELLKLSPSDVLLQRLQLLLEKAMRLRLGLVRAKRTKHIRIEMTKVKKVLNKAAAANGRRGTAIAGGAMSDSSPSETDAMPSSVGVDSVGGVTKSAMLTHRSGGGVEMPDVGSLALKVLIGGGLGEHGVTPPCSPLKSVNSSASPSGVNRRTAVLFTRKAQAVKKTDTPVKEENVPSNTGDAIGKMTKKSGRTKRNSSRRSVESMDGISVVGGSSGGCSAATNTIANTASGEALSAAPMAGPSGLLVIDQRRRSPDAIGGSGPSSFRAIPDSFRVYRAQENRVLSDSEASQLSFTGSTCSSCSAFDDSDVSGSEFGSSFDDNAASGSGSDFLSSEMDIALDQCEPSSGNPANSNSARNHPTHHSDSISDNIEFHNPNMEHTSGPTTSSASMMDTTNATASGRSDSVDAASTSSRPMLEPLQLVWAKCRGYPWYPALIIDPAIPRGFIYNGVPLPAPPADVLALRKDIPVAASAAAAVGGNAAAARTSPTSERPLADVFLVLFFDAKRTWQWLPPNKLELLGLDKQMDQSKLIESRKPADRKAVKKAYQDALHYQSQVSDLDGQGPGAIM